MLRLIFEDGDHRMAEKTGRLVKVTQREMDPDSLAREQFLTSHCSLIQQTLTSDSRLVTQMILVKSLEGQEGQ